MGLDVYAIIGLAITVLATAFRLGSKQGAICRSIEELKNNGLKHIQERLEGLPCIDHATTEAEHAERLRSHSHRLDELEHRRTMTAKGE